MRKATLARAALLLSGILAGCAAVAADAPAAPPADAAPALRTAHVTYVSGPTIYLDAGSDDGLAVSDAVEVVRGDAVAARLKVTYVSGHRASCEPDGAAIEVKVGDAVRFTPHAAPADAAAGAAGAAAAMAYPSSSGESAFRRAGLRGRIGARYLWVKDRSGIGEDLSQPELDLFLQGTQIGGAPVDLLVDVRDHRTYRTPAGGSSINSTTDRLYAANVAYRPGSFRIDFGRQTSPTLAVVSLFDGITAEYAGARVQAGILAGTQPDPVTYAYSSDVRQYGAYVRTGSLATAPTRWSVGFGLISSTENGQINRDFAYVEGRVTQQYIGVYAQQQVDINRGWRKDAEGQSFTPSGTFVMIHARPAASWAVDAGYDSRRNVRLYPDFVTPSTEFDAATRQGVWAGFSWRPQGHWLLGIDARRSSGGTAGTALSYTARFGATNLTSHAVDTVLRTTRYTGPSIDGWLADLAASMGFGRYVRAEIHGGTRHDTQNNLFATETTVNWMGAQLDVLAGRSVYFNVSYDRTSGGEEDNDQVYAAVSWRF